MDFELYMREALAEAAIAANNGEVPVGAVVVRNDVIVSRAHNLCEQNNDASCHAELLALKAANASLGGLEDCTLFVTLEPCAMCTGAMLLMRLPRLVYGAFDERAGCCGSVLDLSRQWFFHEIEVWGGILEAECASILTDFFSSLDGRKG